MMPGVLPLAKRIEDQHAQRFRALIDHMAGTDMTAQAKADAAQVAPHLRIFRE